MKREEVRSIGLSLSRAGEMLLVLELDRDGGLARSGDGTIGGPRRYARGTGLPECFLAVEDELTSELLARSGQLVLPDSTGDEMVLEIRLAGDSGNQVLRLEYGADSLQPPEDVQRLVSTAVSVTDDWYDSIVGSEGGD